MECMSTTSVPVGQLLRGWRTRRRMSQLDLALDAEISTRHLSFLETGRANPSREMILRLAERMEIPLRERNMLLLAGGFAPVYAERPLESPELVRARDVVQFILDGHMPYPALAIDRHWNLQAFNAAIGPLLVDVDPALLQPPVNVLRVSLHPAGLAPRIENLAEWGTHLLNQLDRQIERSADPTLVTLREELRGYPLGDQPASVQASDLIVPLVLRSAGGTLRFVSTTTVFGTPVEITLSELAIESFFPADVETAALLKALPPVPVD